MDISRIVSLSHSHTLTNWFHSFLAWISNDDEEEFFSSNSSKVPVECLKSKIVVVQQAGTICASEMEIEYHLFFHFEDFSFVTKLQEIIYTRTEKIIFLFILEIKKVSF
jgi:hypothetical protein